MRKSQYKERMNNKSLYSCIVILFLLGISFICFSTTSIPSSTQQAQPTSFEAGIVPATTTSCSTTTSTTPTPVITEQPCLPSPPAARTANPVIRQQHTAFYTDCLNSLEDCLEDCLTQEQSWPYLSVMLEEYRVPLAIMVNVPCLWPVLATLLLYGSCCNPPFPEGIDCCSSMNCCQTRSTASTCGTLNNLLDLLAPSLNRPILSSDVIILWLSRFLGIRITLMHFCVAPQPSSVDFISSLTDAMANVLFLPPLNSSIQYTTLAQLGEHFTTFGNIITNHPTYSFTSVMTIYTLPQSEHQMMAFFQRGIDTQWVLLLPSLETTELEPECQRQQIATDIIQRAVTQSQNPHQPVICIRFFFP